jgi:general L-amino acid transport system permease protein
MMPGAGTPGTGALRWARRRLFGSPLDALITMACGYALFRIVPPVLDWTLLDATWHGASREDCAPGGACWAFIGARLDAFLYGFYPAPERWRIQLVAALAVGLVALALAPGMRRPPGMVPALWLGLLAVGGALLLGGFAGLPPVETREWGGLMLNIVVASGASLALPFGILLALGRRSGLKLLRTIATITIEFWRGVPMIVVILLASIFLPLMVPEGLTVNKLAAAIVGLALVEAAYMAEVVRGGLQAIPAGQTEAAQALGLGYWRAMALVVLPQALRVAIPGLVNEFISLFKNTTLVLIVSLFDLLGMVEPSVADPKWVDRRLEGYVFAGLIFWLICFGLSRYSVRLERRLAAAQRR